MNNKERIDSLFARIEDGKSAESELDNIGIFIFDIIKKQYIKSSKLITDLFGQYSTCHSYFYNSCAANYCDYYDSLIKLSNRFCINTTDRDGVGGSTFHFPIDILYMDMESGEIEKAIIDNMDKQVEEIINNYKIRQRENEKLKEEDERKKYEELKKKFEVTNNNQ